MRNHLLNQPWPCQSRTNPETTFFVRKILYCTIVHKYPCLCILGETEKNICIALSVPFFLLLSFMYCLSACLSVSLTLTVSLSLSLFLYVSLALSLSLSVFSVSFCLSLSPSLYLILCKYVSICKYFSVIISVGLSFSFYLYFLPFFTSCWQSS